MRFRGKAGYTGPFDADGIHSSTIAETSDDDAAPDAVAQYGWRASTAGAMRARMEIAHGGFRCRGGSPRLCALTLSACRYGSTISTGHARKSVRRRGTPGLAQGNGVSMLVRAAAETGDGAFAAAAHRAFQALELPISRGGVLATSGNGAWIEECIVDPPSHILNGVHLGTMGRARLRAVEPPSSCNSAMGYMCHDARGTA